MSGVSLIDITYGVYIDIVKIHNPWVHFQYYESPLQHIYPTLTNGYLLYLRDGLLLVMLQKKL